MASVKRARIVVSCIGLVLLAVPGCAAGQTCAWAVQVGAGIPLRQLPPRDTNAGDVRTGTAVALGRLCGAANAANYGFSVAVHDHSRLQIAYLFGDFGHRWALGGGERTPWFLLRGRAGLAGAVHFGAENPLLVPGRKTKVPSLGLAFGFGPGLGVPVGPGAVVVDASIVLTLLETELVGEGGDRSGGGFTTLVSVPLFLGFRFSP